MPPARRFPFQGPRPASPPAHMPATPIRQQKTVSTPTPAPQPSPTSQPKAPVPSPAENNPLQALLRRLDGDTLLILAVLLLLSKEQTDRRLLLALAYIIL